MAKFLLSRRARADLREIWNYTADHWDIHQANRYVLQIRAAIQAMADDPAKGRPCDHIRPGYRKYSVGVHVLFFRLVSNEVEIVPVLHQRMDFERHL